MPGSSPHPRFLAVCVAAVFVSTCPVPASAQTTARVERIIDGETLVVSGIVGPVRLLGVDVPRTIDAQRPTDPDADPAIVFLRTLLTNRTIRLEYDAVRTDAGQRRLAYVYVENGTLVNA